jgi:hypothetical protein
MSFSAKRCAYCTRPSRSSHPAVCCIAAHPSDEPCGVHRKDIPRALCRELTAMPPSRISGWTFNHVVQGTSAIEVRTPAGDVVAAKVIGTAPSYDLAVVRLRDSRQLSKPIAIGSSAPLQVGQWAFAIGNPFGLDHSLTTGVISALRRLPAQRRSQNNN